MGPLGGAIALWFAGQIASPSVLPEPRGTQARIEAKEATWNGQERITTARGDAVLRTEELVLRADELVYDELAGTALAKGNVRLVQDVVTAYGDELTIDLDTLSTDIKGGLLQEKRRVSVQQLRNSKSAEEIKGLGENILSMTGTHIRRVAPHRYLVDHLAFTPCDCNPNQFNWKIKAFRGDVEPGERAVLYLPVIYINNIPLPSSDGSRWEFTNVPVLPLPVLYLPMSERRSGLLIPDVKFSSPLNGFSIDQPLFLTLGRSQDLTITPGYYFGAKPPDTLPADGVPESISGIKGPRLRAEYRYVLKDGDALTPNHLNVGWLYDLKHQRDPVTATIRNPERIRGSRWETTWLHQENFGKGFRGSVNVAAVSDGYFVKDLIADILQREQQYLRSTALLSHQTESYYASIDLGLRQDVRWGYSLLGSNIPLDNDPTSPNYAHPLVDDGGHPIRVRGPNTLHRLPVITFALPERSLVGPVYGGLVAEYSRLAPLRGLTGDEGRKGIFDPGYYDEDGSQGNGRFEPGVPGDALRPGEREARDRLDLNSRLSSPFRIGQAARITPYLTGREDIYFGEVTGRMAQRGYVFGGGVVETELARSYSTKSSTFWHAITPSVDVRYLPYIFGAPLGRSYDEIDLAVPGPAINPPPSQQFTHPGLQPPSYGNSVSYAVGVPVRSFLQAVTQVRQRLQIREGSQVRELARLDVGQGFDVLQGRIGDTFGRVQASQGPLSASLVVRYDVGARQLAQFSSSATVRDNRGDFFSIGYDDLALGGSDVLRRGIDELVGPKNGYVCPLPSPYADNPPCPGRAQQLTISAVGRRFGFELGYSALIQPLLFDHLFDYSRVQDPGSGFTRILRGIGRSTTQQTVSLSYGPACDCWRIGLSAGIRPPTYAPEFHMIFTVSQFGSFGL